MNVIKILWVDDKFQDPNHSFTQNVQEDIAECQDQENTIDVDMVSNREDFIKHLNSAKTKYAAIILDAETVDSPDDSPDIKTFGLHLRSVDNLNYKIMKYVYSSFPDQVEKMAVEYGYVIRDKSKTNPYELLLEIKDHLVMEFPVVPELMMSIREGFISALNEKYMRNIVQSYYNVNNVPLEDMRYILEDIFKQLEKLRLIDFRAYSVPGRLSAKVNLLLNGGEIDGKKFFIPYNICPIEVRYAVQCLEPCSQLYHHDYNTTWERMNNQTFKNQYEQFFKEMAYNAFFITMRWYYHFMSNEKQSPSNGVFTNKKKNYYA